MQVFNRHVSARGLTVFGFETMLISGSILLAAYVHGSFQDAMGGLWRVVLITILCELCFYYSDLYDLTIVHSKNALLVRILQGAGLAAITLGLISAFVPAMRIGPGIYLTAIGLLLVAVPMWRFLFNGVTKDPHLDERVLIFGNDSVARIVAQEILSQHDFGYRIVGFVEDATDLPRLVAQHQASRIVVSMSDRRGKLPINELLQAKLAGVRVEDAATIYERITGKILIDGIKPSWLIFSDGFRASRLTRIVKRAVDVTLAAVGLVLAAPLMLLTTAAVRLDSPGPVLYRQQRMGEGGRLFTLFKFRSMRADAETGTPIWATDQDDRVTKVGRFIRTTRLDELPQLWNVLRGDMSFVGPRPERPFFVEQLAAVIPFYMERHVVKPGITGWAQVKYRYGSSIEDATEKLRYDLYYIKHLSIFFDLTIVMDTVKVILSGKGAK
jgi:sugar transferase (PEP-CTERM system associated)